MEYEIQIKFEGDNEVSCDLLLDTLKGFKYLSDAAQKSEYKKGLKIIAVEKGSFVINMKFDREQYIGEIGVEYGEDVLNTVNDWLEIKEFSGAEGVISSHEFNGDDAIIYNNKGEKKKINKESYLKYNKNISNTIADISTSLKENNKSIKIGDMKTNNIIDINTKRVNRLLIKKFELPIEEAPKEEVEISYKKVKLKVLKANFETLYKLKKGRWGFKDINTNGNVNAQIEDEEFIDKLKNNEIKISVDSILDVKLRYENTATKKEKIFIHKVEAYENFSETQQLELGGV